uniref:Uncharacterized protein n=1 Tax=Schistocephalus solidus TaxID=70667 RepID=A0A0X3PJ00_SCHSO
MAANLKKSENYRQLSNPFTMLNVCKRSPRKSLDLFVPTFVSVAVQTNQLCLQVFSQLTETLPLSKFEDLGERTDHLVGAYIQKFCSYAIWTRWFIGIYGH